MRVVQLLVVRQQSRTERNALHDAILISILAALQLPGRAAAVLV
jgi:hypothetical protein